MAKTKRCFSRCRQLPEENCKEKTRLCQYTKGTRKYSRISKFYTLDKNCDMIKKKKKITKKEASKKIRTFILNKTKKRKLLEKEQEDREKASKKISNFILNKTNKHKLKQQELLDQEERLYQEQLKKQQDRENALKKVGTFVLKNKSKLRANYLKTICADSGACISFGTEVKKINELFEHFINFKYAVSPTKAIGAVSANGFVKEIKYSRNNYESYTVLKSSIQNDSDNLMYEYEVGINFINKQNKIFPCFLETYGMFLYKDNTSWVSSKNTKSLPISELSKYLNYLPNIDYVVGCQKSKYIALLIQHVKDVKTIEDFITEISRKTSVGEQMMLINYDLPSILYQVYMPLATLANEFTHYDLHGSNVLLYEPIKGAYMTYNYHLTSGKTVKFNSRYIAKIIDYGRAYYDDGTQTSLDTYKKICKIKECNPSCGENLGFAILGPEIPAGTFDYITSQNRNISADLRLINIIKNDILPIGNIHPTFENLLDKIVFKKTFGTKEIVKLGFPKKINNVKDACKELEEYILKPHFLAKNEGYYNLMPKIGDFHIYQDGRSMNFIKA